MYRTNLKLQKMKGNNSINTDNMVMVFDSALPLIHLYHCVKFHLFIFNTFRDIFRTNLLLQKLGREITVITCDRVTVLAFSTSSDGHLSMYQVSFNPLLYFQRYAPDKLFIAKIKKGSNSVNAGDRVMVFAFCISPHGPLSHLFIFNTFRDMLQTSLLLQKLGREITL